MRRPTRREVSAALVLAAVLAASLAFSPEHLLGQLEAIADDPVAFGLVVLALYLVRPLVAWPPTALGVVVGYGFGVGYGLPIALAGAALTSLPAYAAVRWYDDGSGWLASVGASGRRYFRTAGDVRGVTAARLAPLPADAVSVAAGVAGVPPRAFIAGSLVGQLPWSLAAVVVGDSMSHLTRTGLGAVSLPLVLGAAAAAALLLAGPAYRAVVGHAPGETA